MNKKFFATIALAISLANGHCGQGFVSAEANPYAIITQRNLFGLRAPNPGNSPSSADLPPQITVCGTMSIFGRPQVLFKVAGTPQPGQTVSETSHILAVGEIEAGVAVIQINLASESITFNNHNLIQTISLGSPAAEWKAPIPGTTITGPIPAIWGTDHLRQPTETLSGI